MTAPELLSIVRLIMKLEVQNNTKRVANAAAPARLQGLALTTALVVLPILVLVLALVVITSTSTPGIT